MILSNHWYFYLSSSVKINNKKNKIVLFCSLNISHDWRPYKGIQGSVHIHAVILYLSLSISTLNNFSIPKDCCRSLYLGIIFSCYKRKLHKKKTSC